MDMVTLDGGAGVNGMTEKVRKTLDLQIQEAPFQLRMADQTIAKPLGMVNQVPIRVGGVEFETTFIILNIGEAYDMLLGRPWLRAAGAVHDWGADKLAIELNSRKVSIDTRPATVPVSNRPGLMYMVTP